MAAGGCADLLGPGGEDRIEENRDRWRSARPAAYRFTYARNCFCAGTDPVEIRVEGEEVVQVTPVEGEGSPPLPISSYPSIDGLFDQLREWDSRDPYRATMEFDDGLGYPTRAFFDFRETVADEEMGFRVSGFRALDETEE